MEMTDWFPPDIKPVHSGVYQTEFAAGRGDLGYSRWDGVHWRYQYLSKAIAAGSEGIGSQNKRWRGLATKPEVNHG